MTAASLKWLAFDYGASSGRAIAGEFDGAKLQLEEIHRFANEPVWMLDRMHWDFLRLFAEMKRGLLKFKDHYREDPDSIGIDTWGVDYGIVDGNGVLLENPYHYRDSRTMKVFEDTLKQISKDELYRVTGIQPLQINTMFQLLAWQRARTYELPEQAKVLFMPDLFHLALTGEQCSEYTIASTSGLLDPYSHRWNDPFVERLSIDHTLLAPVLQSGSIIGALHEGIRQELQVGQIPVIAVACHDTASAVVATPIRDKGVFISCGTWALMGVETEQPVITERSGMLGFTNEGGAGGKIRLMKNLTGMWLLQECRRRWELEGHSYSWSQLQSMAEKVKNDSYFDPSDSQFLSPGDMPARIRRFCVSTGQYIPQTHAEIVRCILESLALTFKKVYVECEEIMGQKLGKIHMVGGGAQNKLLCRLTADAVGEQVVAGPVEATAIGNVLMQGQGAGEIRGIEEIREIVENSFQPIKYDPTTSEAWSEKFEQFCKIVNARSLS